jgi:hypothetical protein
MRGEEYVCADELDDDVIEKAGGGSSSEDPEEDDLLKSCLPVSGRPLDPSSGPPQDADEYLRQVQWERMHCPEVVDVDIVEQPPKNRKRRGLVGREGGLLAKFGIEVPVSALPRREWVEDVAASVRHLRTQCANLRAEACGSDLSNYDAWRERCTTTKPSADVIAAHDFVSINHLVVVAISLLTEHQGNGGDEQQPEEAGITELGPLGAFAARAGGLAEWTFAALLFVEEPLVDDIMFQIQRLRRACQSALVVCHAEQDASPAGPSSAAGARARAALLLAVAEEVFGQR